MRIEIIPSIWCLFLKVYSLTCHNWFLVRGEILYEMRTDYQREATKALKWHRMTGQLLNTWQLTWWQAGLSMHVRTKTEELYLNEDGCWKFVCLAMTLSCQCYWNSNKLLQISFGRGEIPVIIFPTRNHRHSHHHWQ